MCNKISFIVLAISLASVFGQVNNSNDSNSTSNLNPALIRRLLTSSDWNGGYGGIFYTMESLDWNAYITKICIRYGALVDQITVYFNNGEIIGPYGGSGGIYSCYSVSNNGACITAVNGRAGALIDGLQFSGSDGTRSQYLGGIGGSSFSSNGEYDRTLGHNTCLKSLYVRTGAFVDGIQFNWHNRDCSRDGIVESYLGTISNVINGQCVGVYLPGNQGTHLIMWECEAGAGNQQWYYDECRTKTIKNQEFEYCLGVYLRPNPVGTRLILWTCDGSDNQKWDYNPDTNEIKNMQFGLCLGFADGIHPDVVLQSCDGIRSHNQKNKIQKTPI